MIKKKKTVKYLTPDQLHFNKETKQKKGDLKSKKAKRYLFGHFTNVRKGRT